MADNYLDISRAVRLPLYEVQLEAVRAQGPGGQNVNKVSSAVHLRFDIEASSLPDFYKQGLLALKDRRINKAGVVVIKAQQHRSQDKNKSDALERLKLLIQSVKVTQAKRIPTKPTRSSQRKRVDGKTHRGRIKALRGSISE